MTHACRYVIEFELHGGRSRNETTVAMNRGIHGHRCQSDCARRISNESNCSSVLQDFENCEIDSQSAGRSLEVTDTAKSQAIRPGIVSSTPCRYADWLQHNTGVLQYRIARPIPFERFGSHTAENTAGIDHRGERTDSRTKSATKDIRHHVGLRYEKILRSGRGTHQATFLVRGTNLRGLLRPTQSTWQLRTLHRRITVQREEDPVQGIALHRSFSFERKLEHEPGLWTDYTAIINKCRILARFLPVAWRGLQTLEFQKKGSNGFR